MSPTNPSISFPVIHLTLIEFIRMKRERKSHPLHP
jgi:hypothetical protein